MCVHARMHRCGVMCMSLCDMEVNKCARVVIVEVRHL